MIDLDELCFTGSTEWVWAGALVRFPDHSRALIRLSPDGSDAVTLREFDINAKRFVDNGFVLPIAKTFYTSWIDDNSIFVATDLGPESLTTSNCPRIVKRLHRGESLAAAESVFEIDANHMMAAVDHDHTVGFERDVASDVVDFFHRRSFLLRDDGSF